METLISFVDFTQVNLNQLTLMVNMAILLWLPMMAVSQMVDYLESIYWANRFNEDNLVEHFVLPPEIAALPSQEEMDRVIRQFFRENNVDLLVAGYVEEMICQTMPVGVVPAHMQDWPVQPCNNNLLLYPGERLMGEGVEPRSRLMAA